ncbi:MAG: hypothetical protein HN467_02340 [Opitutae bacterium]|nr:hypothetical protein [Opitutae bacterium]
MSIRNPPSYYRFTLLIAFWLQVACVSRGEIVHRYSFDGGGRTARDTVGTAHGDLHGGARLNGKGSLVLDGNEGWVALPQKLISALSDMSLECWLTWEGPNTSQWQRILEFGSASDYLFLTPLAGNSPYGLRFAIANNGPEKRTRGLDPIPVNAQSHHIVLSYDASFSRRANLYLDGELQASGPASIPLSDFDDAENWLGRSRYESLPFFKGEFHEFRIHGRALSTGNVMASYTAGPDNLPGPNIANFVVSPLTIRSGESASLSWVVSGSTNLQVSPGSLALEEATGTRIVHPTQSTTYTLRATNDDGTREAKTTVVVDDRPIIHEFMANTVSLNEGQPVTLSWNVQYADELNISPGNPENLPSQATLNLTPIRTTFYTLSATNIHGAITAGLLVEVIPEKSLIISEFMAENDSSLPDGDGGFEDWIEIENISSATINLKEFFLSDESANLQKWRLPDLPLPAGDRFLVFASGKGILDAGGFYHTNFRLRNTGEYLALSRGQKPVSEFHPAYPKQFSNISFGAAQPRKGITLVAMDGPARFLIPNSGELRQTWTGKPEDEPFQDSEVNGWILGTQGLGFDLEAEQKVDVPLPYAYWTFDGDMEDQSTFNHSTTNHGAVYSLEIPPLLGEGKSLLFSGGEYVSSLIDVPESRCTHAFWFKTTKATGGLFCVVDSDLGVGGHDRHLFLANGVAKSRIHATERLTTTKGGFNDGKWHHLVHVFGPATGGQKLYIDGVELATGSKTTSDFDWQKRINIGFSNDASGNTYFSGWLDEFAIWSDELNRTQITALANGQARPGSSSGFTRFIETSLENEVFRKGTSVYLRFPFDIKTPISADILRLNIRYDDGFVAWLNGNEVARDNILADPVWYSRATKDRPASEASIISTFDLSSMKSLLRDGSNILAVQLLNESPESPDLLLHAELEQLSKSPSRYMLQPSPLDANAPGVLGFVAPVKFGIEAGLFEEPVEIPLSCSTLGAIMVFTTDGTLPSLENGTQILPVAEMLPAVGKVSITDTTYIRVAAFKENWQSSQVRTRTFIFPKKVLKQATVQPGIEGWNDFGMDTRIINNPQPGYGVRTALYALPSLSVVTPIENLFGDNGIYTRSTSRGPDWERSASIELIFPDGREGFQINAGIQMHGNSSRNHGFTPKNPIRVEFKSKYGPSKLRYKLFNESDRDSFDQILLRPCSTDSWPVRAGNHVLGVQRWHPDHGTYIRDQYMRNLQREMGGYAPHGRYVHLYLDGLYWGIYNIAERATQHSNATYFGGKKADWDIIKDFAELESGSKDTWDRMIALVNTDLSQEANYQILQGNKPDGTPDPENEDYLDVDNLIDYMIQHIHAGAEDWPDHNYWAARRNGPQSTGFHFITWDQEISNDSLVRTHTRVPNRFEDPITRQGPSYVYGKLMSNNTFRWTFIDRVHRHMFNGGLMTPESNRSRWASLQALLDKAIVAESARWGDVRRNPPYTREVDWLKEMEFMQASNGYWDQIHPIVIQRFRNVGLYPDIEAPVLSRHGGKFDDGFALTINNPAATGVIYYTLDGADPRLPGDLVASTAKAYTEPITFSDNLVSFKTRVLKDGEWSALSEAYFQLKSVVDATSSIAVTAINYNPFKPLPAELAVDPGLIAEDFEFIELTNSGPIGVDLEGVRFEAGNPFDEFIFDSHTLEAGGRILLVHNKSAFEIRYGAGLPIVGNYTGKLSNKGEAIRLLAADGSQIANFQYGSSGSWPGRSDGKGSVLEIIDPAKSASDSSNWRSSKVFLGTPGSSSPPIILPGILINEVLTHTDLPLLDTIELYNPTNDAVDLSGWWLSDSNANYMKFQIPVGTTIGAGDYVAFDETHFNPTPETPKETHFSLNSANGDEVYLLSGIPGKPNPVGFVDRVAFGAALNGISFGLVPNGSPSGVLFPNIAPSIRGINSAPKFGPVLFSEILYNPDVVTGQDFNDLEYLEVFNSGRTAVSLANWRIQGGVDYSFPDGTILGPAQALVVLSFNPLNPLNKDKVLLFEKTYGLTLDAHFLGGYSGSLSNTGERLSLHMVDISPLEAPSVIPNPLHDEVRYEVIPPWASASGTAKSINRLEPARYGNDSTSWVLDEPTPGQHGIPVPDTDLDGLPDTWELEYFGDIDQSPELDFDSDGLTNLLEFALASNPANPGSVPVYSTGLHLDTESYFTFTYTRRAGELGLQINLEFSNNLKAWEPAENYIEIAAPTVFHPDGTETLILRDTRPVHLSDMRFLRLRVSSE